MIWRSLHRGLNDAGRPIIDKHVIQSGCGGYTVARVICGGVEHFEAWRGNLNSQGGPVMLGAGRTAAKAKQLAEDHAGAPPSPQAALL